jgi:hypothetical protein
VGRSYGKRRHAFILSLYLKGGSTGISISYFVAFFMRNESASTSMHVFYKSKSRRIGRKDCIYSDDVFVLTFVFLKRT